LVFVLWQNGYKPKEATHLIEVPLTAPKTSPPSRTP